MLDELSGKKAVVTGAAGFIGSHLSERLVEIGAEVYAVDDLSAGKLKNIEFLKGKPNFHFIEASITDREKMGQVLEGCDVIFNNAASKKNVCLIDPKKDLLVNGAGTLNLLELAVKHGVKRFLHASTGSVYGEPVLFPTTEEHPLRPVSYYGVSKLAGERYVDVFNRLYGLNTTILRYFHVYGPRQESNEFGGVVSIFIRNVLRGEPLFVNGDGEQMRSFTYVKDLVSANLLAATSPVASGKVYNVASSIQISINDLAGFIVKEMKSHSKIEHNDPLIGDIKYFDVSSELIKEDLGMEFEKDFWGNMRRVLNEIVGTI